MTLTKPPLERPNSALAPWGMTTISATAFKIKGEGRTLSAALFAEEGVVEIRAIYRDVVVYAALTGNGQFIAVRALHDAHARSQQREVEKIAPVVGQVLHGCFGQARSCFALRDVNGRSRGFDEDLGHLQCHFEDEFHGFANPHLHPCLTHFCLFLSLYCYVVKTQGQQGRGEQPEIR